MDWLDEKADILGKKLHNLSLKQALAAYIIICTIAVIILYALTTSFCGSWQNIIWSKYDGLDDSVSRSLIVYYHDYSKLTASEAVWARTLEIIQTWSILIYSIGGIFGVTFLFYNRKLKVPLGILKEAADKVGNNNLDFEIYYDSKDEMGNLCRSFDLMRKQLTENNRNMWDMMEEQKRLNAAFAHDLRTPLTVLKGYTDLLNKYIPEGKISEDKLLSTLSMMSENIQRLERYSNTMKEINSFDEIPVKRHLTDWNTLIGKLKEVINLMNGRNGIAITLSGTENTSAVEIYLDEAILMEVFENLMSNALRYAGHEVRIVPELSEEDKIFILSVADDGKGFSSKDLSMAVKPYYTDCKDNKSKHFGIGLYIVKRLCEKHGGWISLSNSMNGGAVVTTAFSVSQMDSR